jgi:hypothetical protein
VRHLTRPGIWSPETSRREDPQQSRIFPKLYLKGARNVDTQIREIFMVLADRGQTRRVIGDPVEILEFSELALHRSEKRSLDRTPT